MPVAPVDQYGQLDLAGPAQIVQGVEGGPDGAPGEQHIVDQHHIFAANVHRKAGGLDHRAAAFLQVIPVQVDVQFRHGDAAALKAQDVLLQTAGQGYAPGMDADQYQVGAAAVPLQDFVGHPGQGPLNIRFVHYLSFRHFPPFASQPEFGQICATGPSP